jgi:Uma2 family endonuclease
MAVMTLLKRIPMSREAYDNLPPGPPFFDYVDGEAVEVNRPSVRHQRINNRLTHLLDEHVERNRLGVVAQEISLELPDGAIFGPDITYISRQNRECQVRERGDVYGVPDLLIEILSPTTEQYDRREKMTRYHRAGVQWLWFVKQDSLQVDEFMRSEDGYTLMLTCLESETFLPLLFPGLEIDLVTIVGAPVTDE